MVNGVPKHYDITIVPDFKELTFQGTTIINMALKNAVDNITLNAVDMIISSCQMVTSNSRVDLSYKFNLEEEELDIQFPTEVENDVTLEIIYDGKIQENMKGFYKTSYKQDDTIHVGAITQFETEDARRMFPCFDQPAMKATFSLEVIVDEKFTTVSNTPIKSLEKLPNGQKRVKFDQTPKMSTYLVFLGIAEFESISETSNNIEITLLAHPGLSKFGNESLKFTGKALEYCQTYFDIPYPLPKVELLCTPDFAFGAMENWGAISFREDLLLVFPDTTTTMNKFYNFVVIAHEITHQWFGNLVSPSSWAYIWLNESFADYFGEKIFDHYYPEVKYFDYVALQNIGPALTADAYIETVPIEIPDQKKTTLNIQTLPIIYAKGGTIVRTIEEYIGKDVFQKGLQYYLKKHSYNVASSQDFWQDLEKVSKISVSKIMESWVFQEGYPFISVLKNKNSINIKQERFTFLESSYKTIWIIPITILFFVNDDKQITKKFLLEKEEDFFDIDFEFNAFKVNVDHTGFYRVKYSEEDIEVLGTYIKNGKLSTIDSWNLVNDIYALLKAGKVDLDYYLNFIKNYYSPKYYTSVQLISNSLVEIQFLASGKSREKVEQEGIEFHEVILKEIQYENQDNEPVSYSIIRNDLIKNSGFLGSQKTIDFSLNKFELIKADKPVAPDIQSGVLAIVARKNKDFDWFSERFNKIKNEVELNNLSFAIGNFTDDKLLDTILEEIVFTKVPMRSQYITVFSLTRNPYAISKMWEFFIANTDYIGKIQDVIQAIIIDLIVSMSVNPSTMADMEKFFVEFNKTNEIARVTTKKSFETLKINSQFKNRLI